MTDQGPGEMTAERLEETTFEHLNGRFVPVQSTPAAPPAETPAAAPAAVSDDPAPSAAEEGDEPAPPAAAPPEADPAPPVETFRIKWQGEDREVTREQLIALGQMGFDYTIKSQRIAERERAVADRERALAQPAAPPAPPAEDLDPELEKTLSPFFKRERDQIFSRIEEIQRAQAALVESQRAEQARSVVRTSLDQVAATYPGVNTDLVLSVAAGRIPDNLNDPAVIHAIILRSAEDIAGAMGATSRTAAAAAVAARRAAPKGGGGRFAGTPARRADLSTRESTEAEVERRLVGTP